MMTLMYSHEHTKEQVKEAKKAMLANINFSIFMKDFLYGDAEELISCSENELANKVIAKRHLVNYLNDMKDEFNAQ